MKFRNIIAVLMLIISAFIITACQKDVTEFTLSQDGNFLVYHGDEITNGTRFESGTRLIIRVNEEIVPQNQMIDQVYINSSVNEVKYQYTIIMDRNIELKVTFKEIPLGSSRVSITTIGPGQNVTIEPKAVDNVYIIGTQITIQAPQYHQIRYLIVNDERIMVQALSHNIIVGEATKIVVEADSLEKTHDKITIDKPSNLDIQIENRSFDGYYKIGSQVTFLPPFNYSFTGEISVNERTFMAAGNRFNTEVIPNMIITFKNDNVVINTFSINLDTEGLTIDDHQTQTLYAHGSKVIVKSNSNEGFDIIDTLTINGEEVQVNAVSHEITVESDLDISATFKPFDGQCIEEEITTVDAIHISDDAIIYSQALNVNMFKVRHDNNSFLVFQRDGDFMVRIDQKDEINYYLYKVRYDVEDVKIHQNGFGFIHKSDIIKVGVNNEFSIQLEVQASIHNLEKIDEFMTTTYLVRSNQVGNLEYVLEDKGLDVSDIYLDIDDGRIKFREEAIGKKFDLIIYTDQGRKIIQPVEVIKGINVNHANDIVSNGDLIFQSNLVVTEGSILNGDQNVFGNYHTITFNVLEGDLLVINDSSINLSDIMLKSMHTNDSMVTANSSKLTLFNVVIENTKFGIHAINSDLEINSSKFQNILLSNLLIVNQEGVLENILLETKLSNNIFSATSLASILVVDLYDNGLSGVSEEVDEELIIKTIPMDPTIYFYNNEFKNTKTNSDVLESVLELLEQIDDSYVLREPLRYNLVLQLDGGEIYSEYFSDISINENPQIIIIK